MKTLCWMSAVPLLFLSVTALADPVNPDGYEMIPSFAVGGEAGAGKMVLNTSKAIGVYGLVSGSPVYLGQGTRTYQRDRQVLNELDLEVTLPVNSWATLGAGVDLGKTAYGLTEQSSYLGRVFSTTTVDESIGYSSWGIAGKFYLAPLLGAGGKAWGEGAGPWGPWWIPYFSLGYSQYGGTDNIIYTYPTVSLTQTQTTSDRHLEAEVFLPLPFYARIFGGAAASLGLRTVLTDGENSQETDISDSRPAVGAGFSLQNGEWEKKGTPDFKNTANPDGWLGLMTVSYSHWVNFRYSSPSSTQDNLSARVPALSWLTLAGGLSYFSLVANPNPPQSIYYTEDDSILYIWAEFICYPGAWL